MKRIVLVHAVGDGGMSIKDMICYIKWMNFLGYSFVSLDQIATMGSNGKYLSLVVDDAYRCVKTNLMPILQQYAIPCTLFVPPGLLGLKANDPQLLRHACYEKEDMMSVDDLKEWSKNGFEVGFHTNMHIDLSVTDINVQADDFIQGISKLRELGYNPDKFAYPFGRLPKDSVVYEKLLLSHGIKYAYTLWPGDVNMRNPLLISRICLGDRTAVWWNVLKSMGILDKRFQKKCEKAQRPFQNNVV